LKDKKWILRDLEEPLNDWIIVKKKREEEGPVQNLEPQYDDYVGMWSNKQHLRGKEFWQAKATNSEESYKFKVRYREDIDKTMKVFSDGIMYDINSVYPLDNSKTWSMIIASEVNNNGI